jgi:hypothetical protein
VNGGHLLLLVLRSGAAGQSLRCLSGSSPLAVTGISEEQRNRCSENLPGTRMNTTRFILVYVLLDTRPNKRK